ncbi:putative phage-type endonuclease [Caloranaerobacter azorensis DSM 13643]|uniref:Putative phage-type endonuclease n=1 Tax=Caloranaerobacter azorensis DSM 13643 TaxID=1121264 RepID=A0A1M5TUX4_9FIRM|nr:YqaJ viral recombinase family protein [Caloranaerobacter azorensis]SHH54396.1 putative phage-type endonuclease [Caloranaerobacter azorensis DSM 13643]
MQANVLIKTIDLSHEEWLKWRQKGIGGSDVAAILGINKYKTAFEVYLEKLGEIEEKEIDNEFIYWGNVLENIVAKEFEKRTGKKVRRKNQILQNKDYPFMIANLDRVIVGENALLECKTTSAYNKNEWEDEEVPANYLVQVQHYLAVTGYEKGYIACLIGGNKFIWKEIERDDELIEIIIEAEKKFWHEHVLKGIPPILDGSSAAEKYVKERFKKAKEGLEIALKSEYKDKISRYFQLKNEIKEKEEELKAIENQIKNELGEAEKGQVGNYEIVWKNYSSNRIDTKLLKEKYPEIYNKVIKTLNYRKFQIKEVM